MPKERSITHEIKGIWNPEKKGETLAGFFKGTLTFENDKYDKPNYMIGKLNGEVVLVNPYTALSTKMQNVEKDDFVKIVYEGEKESRSGNMYKSFDVRAWILDDSEYENWDKDYIKFPESLKTKEDSVSSKSQQPESSQTPADSDDDLPF